MHTSAMASPDLNGGRDAAAAGGGDMGAGFDGEDEWEEREKRALPAALPEDLPRSLNDRRPVEGLFVPETEMYDAWQGV